jgi:putative tricarboxylic transport membrane protein
MGDRALGGFGLALAAFFIWQATQIEESFISDPVGPKIFPMIIGGVFALASLAIILRPDAPPEWPSAARLGEVALAALVMVLYALALPRFGFVASTAVASAFLSWRLGTAVLTAMLAGVLIAVGIYAVFHLALGLSLAKGPWGF